MYIYVGKSRDSSVGIATGYELNGRGSISGMGNIIFIAFRQALGPNQPPTQWVPGTLSPGVKRAGHEAQH
jgi:hypothetical protein